MKELFRRFCFVDGKMAQVRTGESQIVHPNERTFTLPPSIASSSSFRSEQLRTDLGLPDENFVAMVESSLGHSNFRVELFDPRECAEEAKSLQSVDLVPVSFRLLCVDELDVRLPFIVVRIKDSTLPHFLEPERGSKAGEGIKLRGDFERYIEQRYTTTIRTEHANRLREVSTQRWQLVGLGAIALAGLAGLGGVAYHASNGPGERLQSTQVSFDEVTAAELLNFTEQFARVGTYGEDLRPVSVADICSNLARPLSTMGEQVSTDILVTAVGEYQRARIAASTKETERLAREEEFRTLCNAMSDVIDDPNLKERLSQWVQDLGAEGL